VAFMKQAENAQPAEEITNRQLRTLQL
jgi:hypothetical protein